MNKLFRQNWIFLAILTFTICLRLFLISPIMVKGHSMDPTLSNNDMLFSFHTDKFYRNDVVIVREPGEKVYIVKRLIGMPGDKVIEKDETLFINGNKIEEPYLKEFKNEFVKDKMNKEYSYSKKFQKIAEDAQYFTNDFEVVIPEGQYLILGDNRLISKDSRSFGLVSNSNIKGVVKLRVLPLNKLELL